MKLALCVVALVLLSACASAQPRQRAPEINYWIPAYLKDSDALCVPYHGAGVCKRVKDVRRFIEAMES